jgi:hypothetical protein
MNRLLLVGTVGSSFGLIDPKYVSKPWTDDSFLPQLANVGSYSWRRAMDLNGADGDTLYENIEPSDPRQGELGDCWLVAAMSSAAENHGQHMTKLFKRSDLPNGKYTIDFFDIRAGSSGGWVEVTVDDQVPCHNGGRPLFVSSRNSNELWPMILEKAFAKFVGGYEHLRGGQSLWAWQAMGICDKHAYLEERDDSTWNIFHNDVEKQRRAIAQGDRRALKFFGHGESWSADDLWKHLANRGDLLAEAACCKDEAGAKSRGLVMNHAYSVLFVLWYRANNGDVIKLVRLRNPWANSQVWNGDWSKDSAKWQQYPDALTSINYSEWMDPTEWHGGEFWMSYDDFRRFFRSMELCHFQGESYKGWDHYSEL